MKNFEERMGDIRSKLKSAKRKRKITVSMVSLCCCVALIAGILLIPGGEGPTTNKYERPATVEGYDPLIAQLSALLEDQNVNLGWPEGDLLMKPESAPPVDEAPGEGTGSYEETTDNQVAGVIEADLIKRSDRHIFYLKDNVLTAYSIEGQNSKALGAYTVGSELGEDYRVYEQEMEMYLSMDCKTVTIIGKCYHKSGAQLYLYLVSLDVTDPENMRIKGSQFITGSYNTSRLTKNGLYVISQLYVRGDVDFGDESTFLPGFGKPESMTYLPMNKIHLPQKAYSPMYTVVSRLDSETLEMEDSIALLSSNGHVYMSEGNIYLTQGYNEQIAVGNMHTNRDVTEITRVSIGGGKLKNEGAFRVDGIVENQYSLDEYEGFLRVVTTVSENSYTEYTDGMTTSATGWRSVLNASLYCIDLEDHSIRAKVERFAPEGESVRSVRFDGDKAYVCTSFQMMDPVFFFDLSDLDNITVKDTGTIDGFSMSLVDFTDGFLMGIGYGEDTDTLKVEMYREGETTVESHCAFERSPCGFSSDYKSYLIDRENQLIGLGVHDYGEHDGSRYLLLHFDGYELHKVMEVAYDGMPYSARAVYIDGYLYLFGDGFDVHRVG